MKEKTVIKRCLALLLAFVLVVSGLTIPKGDVTVAEAAEETEKATNIVGDTTADDATAEAKIGEVYFTTFEKAVAEANKANGVTIELLKDVEVEGAIELTKKITIDGQKDDDERFKITSTTTNYTAMFLIKVADVVELKNVDLFYRDTNMVIRYEEAYAGADVRLTNVDITSTGNVAYGIVNMNVNNTTSNVSNDIVTKLIFDTVTIDMDAAATTDAQRAIVRTGNGGNNVFIKMTNSTLDATGAGGRHGIWVHSGSKTEVVLTDTDIYTHNAIPIYDESKSATIDKTRCSMSIASTAGLQHINASGQKEAFTKTYTTAGAKPVAQIGNTLYESILGNKGAVAAANSSPTDVTIDLLTDVTVGTNASTEGQAVLNNTYGKTITIDGNQHIMTTNAKHTFSILYNGTVNFRSMKIKHGGDQSVIQVGTGGSIDDALNINVTVNLRDAHFEVNTTGDAPAKWGLILTPSKGESTLNFVRSNITLTTGAGNYAIIRTGNGYSKTVNISLDTCVWNVRNSSGRRGMTLTSGTRANITLKDSTIHTKNALPIEDSSGQTTTITKINSVYKCDDYQAQYGKSLDTFANALSKANEGATIEVLNNITVREQAIPKSLTIDGNEHTITTSGGNNAIQVGAHTVILKNMTINHTNTGSAVQITAAGANVSIQKVTINAKNPSSKYNYAIINMPVAGSVTLSLNQVKVYMADAQSGADNHRAIVRTGNGDANVNITIKDCVLDATTTSGNVVGAPGTSGISIIGNTTGTITVEDTVIRTKDKCPIKNSASPRITLSRTNTIFYCDEKEAQIGDEVYDTLTAAINATKDTANNVTIEILKDCAVTTTTSFYNKNSKNITINGNGYTVKTSADNAFRIYGSADGRGTYLFNDMKMVHDKASGALIQVHSTGEYTSKLSTVRLTDVTISNTNNGGYKYGLITALPSSKDANMTLDLDNVDVTMKFDSEELGTEGNAAVIRTGNEEVKTVNINLTDCDIDTTKAAKMRGIRVLKSTTANIVMDNTSIKTKDRAPIDAHEDATAGTITMTDCVLDSATEEYDKDHAPIRGYDAQIGNVTYLNFNDAKEAANAAPEAVTIELMKAVTISSRVELNNANGQNITIDGNGNKVTISEGHAIRIMYSGTVELRDMEILHTGTRSMVQIGFDGDMSIEVNPTLKVSDVKVTVDRKDAEWKYGLILVSARSGANKTTTLDFNNMDVTVTTADGLGAADHAIVRTGNDDGEDKNKKTVDISLTDCQWNMEAAAGVHGILIRNYTTATITMTNSSIITKNVVPIYDFTKAATVTQNNSVLAAGAAEASVGNTAYGTLAAAIGAVRETTTDVTIELLKDVTMDNCEVYNKNGKVITIDGNGYTLTTSGTAEAGNAFRIHGSSNGTGTYVFKDMKVVHGKLGVFIQLRSDDSAKGLNKNATVTLDNVRIENVNNGGSYYGLITTLPSSADANVTLNMNKVNVTMAFNSEAKHEESAAALSIIRTGNDGQKTVNINLTDCHFDTTDAAKMRGIYVMATTTANIRLNGVNSIKTNNVAAIEARSTAKASTIQMNGICMLDSEKEEYNADNNPIAGYDAQIGNVVYLNYADALEIANASTQNITLALLQDITINTCNLGKADKTSTHKIIIEGNNHTITTSGSSSNAFCVYTNVGFKNITIVHTLAGSAIQIYKVGVDVDLSKVKIDATRPATDYNFAIINFAYENSTEADKTTLTTLTLDDTDIHMASSGKGINGQSIIRTGNGNDEKNIRMFIVDSTLDASVKTTYTKEGATQVTGASGRVGIRIMAGVTADIDIIDSTIRTLDVVPIHDGTYGKTNTADIDKTRCILDIASSAFDAKVAQVGNTLYESIVGDGSAVAAANAATTDVTIDLLEDITINNNADILNAKGKAITIDGNMYVVHTTGSNNTFRIKGPGTAYFELKNATIDHKNVDALVQVRDNATSATAKLTDVTINTNAQQNYTYALINMLAAGGESYLDLTRVNVTMSANGKGKDSHGAVIRTGNSGEAKKVHINIVDSHLSTAGATGRTGIVVMHTTTATINMTNSSITTKDIYPIKIYNKQMTEDHVVRDAATKLISLTMMYNDNPILSTDSCINTSESVSNIKLGEAPSLIKEGYFFGGWYKKSGCSRADAYVEEQTETKEFASAFAKLIPKCVMGVKTQLSTNLLNSDETDNATGSIRFVTTVDSLYYQQIGFEYKVVPAGGGEPILEGTTGKNSNKVYKQLYGMNSDVLLTYLPDDEFCAESEYFKALTIEGIPSAYFDATITVRPFWITLDGTTVHGGKIEMTVNDAIKESLNMGSSIASKASPYTNRVVLVSDMHYTTELSRTEYKDEYSWDLGWAGFLGRPNDGASVASGDAFGFTQKGKLDAILADLNAVASDGRGINSVLVLGDLTLDDYGFRGLEYAGGNYLEEFKSYFMETVTNIYGSCYALPGNHDSYPNADWASRIGTNRQHVVDEVGDDAIFVMLDTFAEGKASSASGSDYEGITEKDLTFFKGVLNDPAYADKIIFLCAHHYYKSASPSEYEAEFNEIINTDSRIVCMFDGHTHRNNIDKTFANCPIFNIGGYAYRGSDEEGNSNYLYYDEAYAWGYQVVEWNDEEVHTYHVKPARTYKDSEGNYHTIKEDIIEGNTTIKINK